MERGNYLIRPRDPKQRKELTEIMRDFPDDVIRPTVFDHGGKGPYMEVYFVSFDEVRRGIDISPLKGRCLGFNGTAGVNVEYACRNNVNFRYKDRRFTLFLKHYPR